MLAQKKLIFKEQESICLNLDRCFLAKLPHLSSTPFTNLVQTNFSRRQCFGRAISNWTINSPFPLMVVATPRKSCPFWVKATSLPITKERCRYSSKSLSLNVRLKFGKNDSKCWRLIHFASPSVHHLGKGSHFRRMSSGNSVSVIEN